MEWVEAIGHTVEDAVAAAIDELGISREDAKVEVIQEPKAGFLGLGGQDALVKVSKAPSKRKKRRRRSRGKEKGPSKGGDGRSQQKKSGSSKPSGRSEQKKRPGNKNGRSKREETSVTAPEVSIEEQAGRAKEFLEGLLGAFGLEGEVIARVEDEILFIDVTGDQTEALVGPKGSIMQAIHELTRTVIQRKTYRAPRMRLDINGYGERRRAALKIFAGQVAEKVLDGGGEIMLEPMNPADRKVLHDAVAEIEGVRSFSEGTDPRRSVVIAPTEGD